MITLAGSIFPSHSSYWGSPSANLYSNIAAASGHSMTPHASHMTSHLGSYPHYAWPLHCAAAATTMATTQQPATNTSSSAASQHQQNRDASFGLSQFSTGAAAASATMQMAAAENNKQLMRSIYNQCLEGYDE